MLIGSAVTGIEKRMSLGKEDVIMKKLAAVLICAAALLQGMAYAESGDVKSTLYNTDIVTYLDGRQIKGYSLDGKMMICVEDLSSYGYTVEYDDTIRVLFANKTDKPAEDFRPYYERGRTGGIYGNTFETDIRVFINGIETSAENMGGKMLVVAEDIADTEVNESNKTSSYNPYAEYGISEYFLSHTYDDGDRALYIETVDDGVLSYEEQLSDFLSGKTSLPVGDAASGGQPPQILARKDTEDCTMLLFKWQWMTSIAKFYKNGIQMNMSDAIFAAYKFKNQMTTTIDYGDFSEDGSKCCVYGRRNNRVGMVVSEVFESGFYEIDTDSFVITSKDAE